jgi:hypothetical protein
MFGARFSLVDDLLGLLAGASDNPLSFFLRVGDREVGRLLSEGQDVSRRIEILLALPPTTASPKHLSPTYQARCSPYLDASKNRNAHPGVIAVNHVTRPPNALRLAWLSGGQIPLW